MPFTPKVRADYSAAINKKLNEIPFDTAEDVVLVQQLLQNIIQAVNDLPSLKYQEIMARIKQAPEDWKSNTEPYAEYQQLLKDLIANKIAALAAEIVASEAVGFLFREEEKTPVLVVTYYPVAAPAGQLNCWQSCALKALRSHGLTAVMLLNRNENGHTFTPSHDEALCKLVLKKALPIDEALKIIDGLSSDQADGIATGLEREDVMGLQNRWHIKTLGALKIHGLTVSMLLNRNENEPVFQYKHYLALCHLVLNRQLPIDTAVSMMAGVTHEQAEGITEGLDREDVINLHNEDHIRALVHLKTHGLTASMLLSHGGEFGYYQYGALRSLVLSKQVAIDAAIGMIKGLTSDQLYGITRGLEYEDALGVSNYGDINSLIQLKAHGLTAAMLLAREKKGPAFRPVHHWALAKLLIKQRLPVKTAFEIIDGVNLVEEDWEYKDTSGLCNFWHKMALEELQRRGLTVAMLLDLNEKGSAFDYHHCWALCRWVLDSWLPIDVALQVIAGLTSAQAEAMEQNWPTLDNIQRKFRHDNKEACVDMTAQFIRNANNELMLQHTQVSASPNDARIEIDQPVVTGHEQVYRNAAQMTLFASEGPKPPSNKKQSSSYCVLL
ncbi:MAG: hypothetical protein ACHP65_02790 [Legionellales bacterium]